MRVARQILILVLSLLLVSSAAMAAAGSLHIEQSRVEGTALVVTVSADGEGPAAGSVFAEIVTADGVVSLRADVRVEPGETRSVALAAPDEILGVIVLGAVVDDGSPF